MPNQVFETMTTFKVAGWFIRVWREESEFTMGPDHEVLEALSQVQRRFQVGYHPMDFAQAVKNLPRISAIEILHKHNKDGGLYYPDWK